MKNLTLSILMILLILAFSGCDNKPTFDPGAESTPSAGSSNTSAQYGTPTSAPTPTPEEALVVFSLASGFYDSTQEVSLTCNVDGAEIYYTEDGSTPDKTSSLYQGPITVRRKLYTQNVLAAQKDISVSNRYIPNFSVDKCTVIRAVAYLPDGTATPLSHATYFIGVNREKYGNVPIISVITDFDNLFDYETGIYVLGKTHDDWIFEDPSRAALDGWQHIGNYSNRGREWERPVSVELLTFDGTEGFKQNMGVRIMGGASRNQAQKSLKFYAREEYESKSLKYALIPDNFDADGELISKYKTFVLRVGGNDADFARLRDPYLQFLVKDARFDTQQSTPCIAFINGEYFGLYTINEDYTDKHFENNYGIDSKNLVLIKRGELEEGEEDDIYLFRDMYRLITGCNMAEPEMYEMACDLIDMDSLIDYFAFALYIYNQDGVFENNNWRMWRSRTADLATPWSDGKWRFASYDNDFSSGIYNGPDSAAFDNISGAIRQSSQNTKDSNLRDYHPAELFRALLKNDSFKEKFLLALCDMRNLYFEPEYACAVLDDMAKPYLALMPDTWKRFGPDWIANGDAAGYISSKIADLRSFISKRYTAMPGILKKAFDLEVGKKLNVNVNDVSFGFVTVNNRSAELGTGFSGTYFKETAVTLTAVPRDGYRFSGWEVTGGTIENTMAETITFRMESAMVIKAVFEKN